MSNHVHLTFQPAALGQLLLTSSATNLQAHSWLGETLMKDPLRHIPVCNSSNSQDLPVGGAFVNPPGLTIVYAKSLPGAPGSMKRLSCLFLSTKASLSTARVWRARARLRECTHVRGHLRLHEPHQHRNRRTVLGCMRTARLAVVACSVRVIIRTHPST